MHSRYLVIDLENNREDFADAWNIIKASRRKKTANIKDYKNIYYFDASEEIAGEGGLVAKINSAHHQMKNATKEEICAGCGICLWIKDNAANDIIEYQYLALILQNTEDVICYIYPDMEERIFEVYREVSSYFLFFVQRHNRRRRIWINRRKGNDVGIETLGAGLSYHSYKVMPLIEFEYEEWGMGKKNSVLRDWTRSVGQFLQECEDSHEIYNIEPYQELSYRLGNARRNLEKAQAKNDQTPKVLERRHKYNEEVKNLLRKRNRLEEISRKSEDSDLLCRCRNYFVMNPKSRNTEEMERYKSLFRSEELEDIFEDASFLAFFILCIQVHFMKSETEFDIDEIKMLLINAEELAEGMIQLLENLHHSSEERGLFSIRIHEKKIERNYLSAIYPNYRVEEDSSEYSFEFRVLDYSRYNIVSSFKNSNKKSKREVPGNFGVKDFFECVGENGFWKEYNKRPENLVHHYGLQIFSTIISNNGGRFRVVSSSKTNPSIKRECYYNGEGKFNKSKHIPGTEYDILLPMRYDVKPLNPSVDADIQYQFDMKKQFHVELFDSIEVWQKVIEQDDGLLSGQEKKEKRINDLKDNIQQWLKEKEVSLGLNNKEVQDEIVTVISAKDWGRNRLEILCKALVLCLIEWQPWNNQGFNVIVKDCSSNDFISIARMFAIFYSKGTLSNYMDRLQIYLSGVDQSEEFIIAGNNLNSLFTMASKLTLVRGIQPYCLRSIEYILRKFQMTEEKECKVQELKLVPFDILEFPSTTETLFEQAVKRVLESDIQKYSFGCKVKHTHMRIGSKLHISEFFEAELLFHNNYYVARFALLILRRLEKELHKDNPIMFVGYETYSELLLYEIVTNLNAKGFDSSYMIYEQRQEGTFRYYDSVQYMKEKENLLFILIVPINSSMTTHSKLQAWLYQEIEKAGLKQEICIAQQYAIILIRSNQEDKERDEMEEDYYASAKKGIIKAAFLPKGRNTIQYFVCINTKWSDPLTCEFCFPTKSMLEERPLIETNRSSIIPIQMLGIQEKDILRSKERNTELQTSIDQENQNRVGKLGDTLIYKHVVRNGNHFMFYFELEKYFIQNRDKIIGWLKNIKECKKKSDGIVYDVIVAPLHYSNAGFVAEVNYHLYGNAALVLNFEVDKEFRENVRTKYSNVIGLYKKLIDMGNPAELRFHFVDDNIITGNTFLRAKSLFASLLPYEQNSNVKVKVFDDIIVLLNRMSEASIMNCVQNREDYHAYVFLNISSMRNHEDACILCKVVENSMILRDQSATNSMYEYWDQKIVYHQVKKPEECREIYLTDKDIQQRAIRRMLCTHEINEHLKYMGYLRNEADQVKKVMLQLMSAKKDSEDAIEWIISYIKIFSRPFVSFRKSCQEASFAIMLELIEFMTGELCESDSKLRDSKFTKYGDLKDVCCAIRDAAIKRKQGDKVFSLLLTLMQRLSVLGSNYAIRKENICNLFSLVEIFIQKEYIPEQTRQKFIQKYISIVKRIVCLSSDENKCIYLEYIILFGKEYRKSRKEIVTNKLYNDFGFSLPTEIMSANDKKIVEVLFLENTRVLYDGIHDLNREMAAEISLDSLSGQLEDKYYFKNFKRLLSYYQFINGQEEKITFEKGCAESVLAMVKLYRMLCETGEEQERDVETFYNYLLEYVEIITNAKARLLIPAVPTDVGKIVYKKQRNMEISREEIDYDGEEFVYDTYAISELQDEKKKVLIKYRNYIGKEYSEKEKNQMNEVYLELLFSQSMSRLQIMIAIKCIMIFRDLIVKNMEKDFSNNLMQKWSAEQSFKKNMKLERASDHTDKDELADTLKLISKGINSWEKAHQKALFELVINSYIARFNVQLLADAHPEGENVACSFAYVYQKQLKALLDALHEIEEFKILDEAGEERFSQRVLESRIRMFEDARRCERLSIRRLSIIVIELVLSAIKYSDNQIVHIYREQNYLVAKNTFVSDKDIAVIKQEAHDSSSRKKEGISLAVIKELIDSFYLLGKDEGVIIDAEEAEEKKYYLVKLPIFMD